MFRLIPMRFVNEGKSLALGCLRAFAFGVGSVVGLRFLGSGLMVDTSLASGDAISRRWFPFGGPPFPQAAAVTSMTGASRWKRPSRSFAAVPADAGQLDDDPGVPLRRIHSNPAPNRSAASQRSLVDRCVFFR